MPLPGTPEPPNPGETVEEVVRRRIREDEAFRTAISPNDYTDRLPGESGAAYLERRRREQREAYEAALTRRMNEDWQRLSRESTGLFGLTERYRQAPSPPDLAVREIRAAEVRELRAALEQGRPSLLGDGIQRRILPPVPVERTGAGDTGNTPSYTAITVQERGPAGARAASWEWSADAATFLLPTREVAATLSDQEREQIAGMAAALGDWPVRVVIGGEHVGDMRPNDALAALGLAVRRGTVELVAREVIGAAITNAAAIGRLNVTAGDREPSLFDPKWMGEVRW